MKLQVIKTDKGCVAVSSEPIRCDEASGLIGDIWYVFKGVIYKRDYSHPKDCLKIIATDSTFKLEGIPQFELENKLPSEEFTWAEFRDFYLKVSTLAKGERGLHSLGEFRIGYNEGYKAAQSKGCFTEEDMRKAFDRGEWDGSGKSEATRNAIFYNFIDSLKQPKKLVAIDVETLIIAGKGKGEKSTNILNITKSEHYPDGLLVVKQYYYE